uniref:Prolamin-like domain-containing protein n=1 Tax=Salix viminalis TaxID=40686 RepID=A0A6N2M8D8_SALVM
MAISQNKIFVLLCLIVYLRYSSTCRKQYCTIGRAFPKPSQGMEGCAANGNNNNPSDDCCKKLVATGIDCHNAFTEILISKEPRKTIQDSLRSMDIWNRASPLHLKHKQNAFLTA